MKIKDIPFMEEIKMTGCTGHPCPHLMDQLVVKCHIIPTTQWCGMIVPRNSRNDSANHSKGLVAWFQNTRMTRYIKGTIVPQQIDVIVGQYLIIRVMDDYHTHRITGGERLKVGLSFITCLFSGIIWQHNKNTAWVADLSHWIARVDFSSAWKIKTWGQIYIYHYTTTHPTPK
jgi:hypothetical protein